MKFSLIDRLRNKIRISQDSHIELGNKSKIVGCSIIIKGKNNRFIVADNVRLRACCIEIVGNNCTIDIGKDTMVGHNCYLSAKEANISLSIAEGCRISRNAKIMTSDGHPIFQDNKRVNTAKNIHIGSDVWIADNVTILKGVTVGSGTVIGINSTLTVDLPSAVVAVGNPCRVVKDNITWCD